MLLTQRVLLRLHIEAVWKVQLPPLVQNTVELLREGTLPPWKVYVAEMAGEQSVVWRPDVPAAERQDLLERARETFLLSPTERIAAQISREVVLHQVASPIISAVDAQKVARPLTPEDRALLENFDPGYGASYLHATLRPLIGVIVEGRLLSVAHSSRRTSEACELGIDTLPDARRQGYALAATLLWAASVAQEGLIPFYSAAADNVASLGLAAAAGYRTFARAVTIEE